MNLLELCEPLFQYICRLNRAGRKGGAVEYPVARAEVKGLLSQIQTMAAGDPRLKHQAKAIEMPLIFFVDSMIAESDLAFKMEWHKHRLAYEHNELAGDEKFFDLLEETLRDNSEEASERLAVFYTCLGLGFSGWYLGQPEYLRKKMLECAARLRGVIGADDANRICPEAYEYVNTADLIQPPSSSLVGVGIALVGLVVTLFVANAYLYYRSSNELSRSLDRIVEVVERPRPADDGVTTPPDPPTARPAPRLPTSTRPAVGGR